MARASCHKLCAVLGAFVGMLLPHAGFADLSATSVSDLRRALGSLETELKAGVNAPLDVAALRAKLPLQTVQTEAAANTSSPIMPVIPAPEPQQKKPTTENSNGLFSLQLSQTAARPAPRSAPAAAPAPLFGKPVVSGLKPGLKPGLKTVPNTPQDVGTTNFRLMLTPLVQTYTGENAQAVINAQGPRGPIAVSVRAGSVSLADVQAYSAALGMPPLLDGTLTAPVVVWPGATLRLNPGERMALSTGGGAFLLSMGRLEINGATIEAVGAKNTHTPSFTPFVTVAGGGALQMQNATLRNLGFGDTAKFSGLSVAANLLTQSESKVSIKDSLFHGLKTVSIAGVSGVEISGNTFVNARNNTLNLLNAPATRISGNLFTGGSHTNAIRIEKGSSRTVVADNIMLLGQRVAVLVDGASDNVALRDNIIWKRQGAGIKFLRTHCGAASGNIILDNRQKGIEVRKSDGTVLQGNLIAGNSSSGIWVSAQQPGARTALKNNLLVGNGSGLSAATGAEILLSGNDFSGQLPRLLDGDIARLTHNIVKDLRGAKALDFKNGGAELVSSSVTLCGDDL
ncbi:right-handed parallel beta-helix repeat-containing protein [Lentibacter algarum]|uniref:right-handed parallel beta-helix repeat-containing protein n=1 Tax=Lentibacter algarum TaxID=576131 RepID=UPI001C07630B|nr:right-handed parallel beta-helix repeat-containing protein [Lentibacter algarum]MBU2981406.1 right-handed parallel beta-helix repeat-containing protein [Lentibacter algarum]